MLPASLGVLILEKFYIRSLDTFPSCSLLPVLTLEVLDPEECLMDFRGMEE
jgi:hypothetical protein